MVMEMVPAVVAAEVTRSLSSMATIGIGRAPTATGRSSCFMT